MQSHRVDIVKQIKGWIVPFVLLFFILAYFSYCTLQSLFRPIAWAILLAFLVYPLYRTVLKLVGPRRRNVAAILVTMSVVVLLIAPTLYAAALAAREAIGLFTDLLGNIDASKGFSFEDFLPEVLVSKLRPLFEDFPTLKEGVQQFLSWITSTMVRLSRNFLGNIVTLVYHQIIIFIVFYFLLRDGHVLLRYIKDILPLMGEERQQFMQRADVVLRAVVFGVLVTAGVQGTLGAFGWWFVGLSSPILAGALMALLAMIPFVGTPVVWIPGVIYLVLVENFKGAIFLAVWGLGVVSTVDNFLRPYFISGRANMSALLVFLGAFGGLAAWGFIGLFMGPLVLSLSIFFMESYRKAWKAYRHNPEEGNIL